MGNVSHREGVDVVQGAAVRIRRRRSRWRDQRLLLLLLLSTTVPLAVVALLCAWPPLQRCAIHQCAHYTAEAHKRRDRKM